MLDEMLTRIDHRGPVCVDTGTLTALHRAWRQAVPYENLDIQLGRPIRLDEEALYDKLIRRRRGGYCFEQNGALALLLRAAGFDVAMAEGAVLREAHGDAMWGNHNVLVVEIDGERWLADAGIGDGFVEPLPLREGTHRQSDLVYRLEQLGPDTWRFHHHPGGSIASYDFGVSPRQITDFAERSDQLSTSSQSVYVNTLVVGRPVADQTMLLLSRTLRRLRGGEASATPVRTVEEFDSLLTDTFLIPLDDLGPGAIDQLWEKAVAQHDLWRARAEKGQR